jgi:hypothetical protein
MQTVKTIRIVLSEDESEAIGKVLDILDSMWEQNEDCEMEELWERYGSNEEKWICVDHTLRNLLNGGRTV